MIRAAAALTILLSAAGPAFATEWIDCADGGMNASVSLLTGTLDVLSIAAAKLDVGDSHWVSDPAYIEGDVKAEPLSVGQGFEDPEAIRVDLMDAGFAKLAELRLFKASEDGDFVYAGTLHVPGRGAWAVSCSGP